MEQLNLKEIRKKAGITQEEAAKILEISVRSFKTYENDLNKRCTKKYEYLCDSLNKHFMIDETHGVLNVHKIKEVVTKILKKYDVNFCYLFGSYAKNKANETSDVDLLIDTEITGLDYYGLIEDLRMALNKKVDLLKLNQLEDNEELLRNILKDGIKIYG